MVAERKLDGAASLWERAAALFPRELQAPLLKQASWLLGRCLTSQAQTQRLKVLKKLAEVYREGGLLRLADRTWKKLLNEGKYRSSEEDAKEFCLDFIPAAVNSEEKKMPPTDAKEAKEDIQAMAADNVLQANLFSVIDKALMQRTLLSYFFTLEVNNLCLVCREFNQAVYRKRQAVSQKKISENLFKTLEVRNIFMDEKSDVLTSLGLSSAQVEQMKRTLWDPLPTLAVSVFKKRADDASKELKEWQQYADSDLRSQLEHARESAAGLHFKMWKALRPANGSRQGTQQDGLGDVANLVGELVVKLRHLLDQAVTRWVNHVRHRSSPLTLL